MHDSSHTDTIIIMEEAKKKASRSHIRSRQSSFQQQQPVKKTRISELTIANVSKNAEKGVDNDLKAAQMGCAGRYAPSQPKNLPDYGYGGGSKEARALWESLSACYHFLSDSKQQQQRRPPAALPHGPSLAQNVTNPEYLSQVLQKSLDSSNGDVQTNTENVVSILQFAQSHKMRGLKRQCVDALVSTLDGSNCCQIFSASHKCGASKLKKAALNHIISNFEAACDTEDFYNLEVDLVIEILKSICQTDRPAALKAIPKWTSYRNSSRKGMQAALEQCLSTASDSSAPPPQGPARCLPPPRPATLLPHSTAGERGLVVGLPPAAPLPHHPQQRLAAAAPGAHARASPVLSPALPLPSSSRAAASVSPPPGQLPAAALAAHPPPPLRPPPPAAQSPSPTASAHGSGGGGGGGRGGPILDYDASALHAAVSSVALFYNGAGAAGAGACQPTELEEEEEEEEEDEEEEEEEDEEEEEAEAEGDGLKDGESTASLAPPSRSAPPAPPPAAAAPEAALAKGGPPPPPPAAPPPPPGFKLRPLRKLAGHSGHVMSLAVHHEFLISGATEGIKVWDARTWRCQRTLGGHHGAVLALATGAGGRLFSGSRDCTIKIWDTRRWECLGTLIKHADAVHAIVFTGPALVSASSDRTIVVWDARSWMVTRTLEGHLGGVKALAVLGWAAAAGAGAAGAGGAGRLLSGSFDRTIRIWGLHDGKPQQTLKGHSSGITALTVLNNSNRFASGSNDDTVRIWEATKDQSWACLVTLRGHSDTVWSITEAWGKLLSGSADKTIKVWNMESWECEETVAAHERSVSKLFAFSHYVVSCSWDHSICLWRTGVVTASAAAAAASPVLGTPPLGLAAAAAAAATAGPPPLGPNAGLEGPSTAHAGAAMSSHAALLTAATGFGFAYSGPSAHPLPHFPGGAGVGPRLSHRPAPASMSHQQVVQAGWASCGAPAAGAPPTTWEVGVRANLAAVGALPHYDHLDLTVNLAAELRPCGPPPPAAAAAAAARARPPADGRGSSYSGGSSLAAGSSSSQEPSATSGCSSGPGSGASSAGGGGGPAAAEGGRRRRPRQRRGCAAAAEPGAAAVAARAALSPARARALAAAAAPPVEVVEVSSASPSPPSSPLGRSSDPTSASSSGGEGGVPKKGPAAVAPAPAGQQVLQHLPNRKWPPLLPRKSGSSSPSSTSP